MKNATKIKTQVANTRASTSLLMFMSTDVEKMLLLFVAIA